MGPVQKADHLKQRNMKRAFSNVACCRPPPAMCGRIQSTADNGQASA